MTIGEISTATGIRESTLRYYEKKELIQVSRDSSGRRIYEENDIDWIRFIKRLKDTGMPLKDIRTYSKLRYMGDVTMQDRMNILEEHRLFVLAEQQKWNEYLENLDTKIDFYKNKLSK